MRTITLIPGDGIGPEVSEAMVKVVNASGVSINWERVDAGMGALIRHNDQLPKSTLQSIEANKVAIKGPCDTPIGGGYSSVNVGLRKYFDLFLNMRPVMSFSGVPARYRDVDLVIFRENIEDVYLGDERYFDKNGTATIEEKAVAAEVRGVISRYGCQRFFEKVRDYVLKQDRRKITIVHKANILKKTQGIFLKTGKEVLGNAFPGLTIEDRIIDNMTMQLVLNPNRFDVIVATNMFGDILSDLCAGLIGGLGLAPGANIGNEFAIFEAVHGTAPDIAGQNKANPTALILSAVMMLDHIGEEKSAERIMEAVEFVINEGLNVTKDLNPNGVSTTKMADAIIERMNDMADLESEMCC